MRKYYTDTFTKDEILRWVRTNYPSHTEIYVNTMFKFKYNWAGRFELIIYDKQLELMINLIFGECLFNTVDEVPNTFV